MNAEKILTVLRYPHISEKATILADKKKQYAFKVLPTATKREIKAAVEQFFNVKVKSVTVMNMPGKHKRFKNTTGKRSDWKKAYVTLHEAYDIDFAVAE